MSEIHIDGQIWPVVEPGEYTAIYLHHETNRSAFGGKPKVYLIFRLVDPGVFGEELYAAYNIKKVVGKKSRNGSFKLSRRQDLTLQLANVLPDFRLDRISLRSLINKTVRILVRTVKRDYKQRSLPPPLQYSVVDQILCLEDRVYNQ